MIYDLVGFALQFAVLVFAAYLGTMLALGQFHRQTTGELGETMALSHRLTPRFISATGEYPDP
ncbi:hypothetical protein C483_17743 [Natrialba hulunbeirensis JCM 10989]|uniref:Uncharacterized protein n=1 Tax=Natrialba hulunbeirensis JCM 10989 TaxID=1227493 RepID=L9ZN15_9EURY|nr:hypothetical protein [Natrialba hulunbeirensis]ELY87764.1 hypothetical protein C483_17743 [Natrialba hulunbeirensis JCM 10989]